MDALPVEELTGVPYASTKRQVDSDGIEKPVMHACGHDMHVGMCFPSVLVCNIETLLLTRLRCEACLLGAAKVLSRARRSWSGTLVVLFQPNEERGAGARAMVDAGLYDPLRVACPIPDVVLGQHVMPFRAGMVGTRRGIMAPAADGIEITVFGRGGHASQPHKTIDPLMLACHIVVRLQTIVSREVPPSDEAVLTVGCIEAGTTENIIADSATIKLTIRNNNVATREHVLRAMKRIVHAECLASNSPKPPIFTETVSAPPTINDDEVTARLESAFSTAFGEDYIKDAAGLGGSEDFSILASAIDRPYCYWTFGGSDRVKWDEAERRGTVEDDIPTNHSPFFAPEIEPTLKSGTRALITAVISYLGKNV